MAATHPLKIATEAPFSGGFGILVLRTRAEIETIRSIWTAWQDHPNSDIDFYLQVLRSRGDAVKPYVIVLYRDSRPEAILVARIEENCIDLQVGYLRFPSPKARLLNVVYAGWLGNKSAESGQAFLAEITRALQNREADAAVLRYLRCDENLYATATRVPGLLRRDRCLSPQVHRTATLPNTVESFRARFSAKVRKNHRWQAKKFVQENGDVAVRCFRAARELDELFHDVERVAHKTYQRGLKVGFEDTRQMRDRFAFEAERGTLRAFILYAAGNPAAFWIGNVYKKTFFSSFMGYDPALARYSPGIFLVLHVIESFCVAGEREVERIDFGLGDAPYKSLLGDGEWQEGSVYVFGSGVKSLTLNAVRTPLWFLDRHLRRALSRLDMLGRIKRLWRNRARLRTSPQNSRPIES